MHLFNEVFGPYAPELLDLMRFIAFLAIIGILFKALDYLRD
jgi:hypothetical protein